MSGRRLNNGSVGTFTHEIISAIVENDEPQEKRGLGKWHHAAYNAVYEEEMLTPSPQSAREEDPSLGDTAYNLGVAGALTVDLIELKGPNVQDTMRKYVGDAFHRNLAEAPITAYREDDQWQDLAGALDLFEEGFEDYVTGELDMNEWALNHSRKATSD
jgi:hypothetical protein